MEKTVKGIIYQFDQSTNTYFCPNRNKWVSRRSIFNNHTKSNLVEIDQIKTIWLSSIISNKVDAEFKDMPLFCIEMIKFTLNQMFYVYEQNGSKENGYKQIKYGAELLRMLLQTEYYCSIMKRLIKIGVIKRGYKEKTINQHSYYLYSFDVNQYKYNTIAINIESVHSINTIEKFRNKKKKEYIKKEELDLTLHTTESLVKLELNKIKRKRNNKKNEGFNKQNTICEDSNSTRITTFETEGSEINSLIKKINEEKFLNSNINVIFAVQLNQKNEPNYN